MKAKRILLSLVLVILMQSALILFGCNGCGKNYDKVSIELDKTVMTMFMDETLNQEGSNKLKATILGLDEKMVDSFSFLVADPNIATINQVDKNENVTNFEVTPYMGGETNIYIISNETSTKTATATLRVIEPIENVEVDSNTELFLTIGSTEKSIKILPSNVLKFTPETTSEKFYSFEILNYNSEVASYDNETNMLTIKPEIEQGVLQLKAKFDFDKEKSVLGEEVYNTVNEISSSEAKSRDDLIINIYIIKDVDLTNFTLKENGNAIKSVDGKFSQIELIGNNKDFCYKEVTASISEELTKTEGFTYSITASCTTGNDMEVTVLSPEDAVNDITFKLTAVLYQKEKTSIRFTVKLKEIEGYEKSFDLPFTVILIPETIEINGDDSLDEVDAVVYSKFVNRGTKFTVNINPIGAKNRKFFIEIPEDFVDMIDITNATDGIKIKSNTVLQSGQTFYINSKNSAIGDIYINIVSLGTSHRDSEGELGLNETGYEGIDEISRRINLKLVVGAEKINTVQDLYIEKGQTFDMGFSFDNNDAFTEYIYAKALDETICLVPEIMDGTSRSLPITTTKAGKTSVVMELSNGVSTQINIISYITFDDFGITLPSVNDINSPVSEAEYTTGNAYDTTKVKTVTKAKIKINSALYMGILPYVVESISEEENRYIYNEEANTTKLNKPISSINFTQVFESSDTSILKTDSTGYMTCLKEGSVTINCKLTVYVNDPNNPGQVTRKTLSYSFDVDVIIPIESFEIIGSSINVYAYNRLSYYDQLKGAGTISVNVRVTPSNATFDPNDIKWTVDSIFLSPKDSEPVGMNGVYNCYLVAGQTTQTTSINVSLSANGRTYTSTKTVTITSPRKVTGIRLNNVLNYTLDSQENKIPYLYFDGRKGLNDVNNSKNLKAECIPQNAYNTTVRYIVGTGLGGDPNPIIKVDEKGNIIPIANGYCYLYIVAEDWFNTASDYQDYIDSVTIVAVKVADGKTKATAIDISTASDLMAINTVSGLKLHYILQENIDLTNYVDFISFGLFEKEVTENDITTTILEKIPFTGSLDGCFNVFGTATQYKITGLSLKNTKYAEQETSSLYYNSSYGNNYTLDFGLFAINEGELSNLICNVSSIMISTKGLDDKATTNFGVLAGVNKGLIENCQVMISNLSGNALYVNANTTFVNIGIITGVNKATIEQVEENEETNYIVYNAYVNNCITDGTLNVKIYSSTQKDGAGNTLKGSRNTVYVGGLVGKNIKESIVVDEEKVTAKAVIQTVKDNRNEKYKDNYYSYYNGNITFESEEMNVRGVINVDTDTSNYIKPVAIGGICGYNDSEIKNIASEITINALSGDYGVDNVGGIVGYSYDSVIEGVYFSGKVTGSKNVGGIAGSFSGQMENAITEFMDTTEDEVFADASIKGIDNVGGIVGYTFSRQEEKSSIKYSFARSYYVRKIISSNYIGDIYVKVYSNETTQVAVGGLVGFGEHTTIENCYAYINMYIDDEFNNANVGGICGYSDSEMYITNCYLRGRIYISYNGEDAYNVTAISNNETRYTASKFYSTCGVLMGEQEDYKDLGTNKAGQPDIYVGVQTINDISNFDLWPAEIWCAENYYNNNLPYIKYYGKRMLSEPPSSISYVIKPSTINSTSDLYKLNKFIKVNGDTILLFKYDNEDLDSYNLNKILTFTIPPYFTDGVAQFDDMASIRLKIKSSDTSIAQINTNGNLVLYGEGTVQITISSMLNKNAFTTINIVVMNVTTGFNIYKDNLFLNPIDSSYNNRILIKKGTNTEIYPYISGNSDMMIEYSVNSSAFYPIIFANSGEWTQKDLLKSCMDISYTGTHVMQAINAGTIYVEAKLFVTINGEKVYLPYTKTFYVQSFEGLNDFTISNSSFSGIIKDRYEFTVKVSTDIVDRTIFTVEGLIENEKGKLLTSIDFDEKNYLVKDLIDIVVIKTESTSTYALYSIYVEINDDFKASEIFFNTRKFVIRCSVDDGQHIDYGIEQTLELTIQINPQDVSSVETMFFSGAEVIYDENLSNPMYNVAETDTDVITAGEIGIFKVFVYPEFSQIRDIYIYATSSDGKYMSMEQVALREGTVPGQNTYYTLSPAPANYSTIVAGVRYQGLHANIVSNVVVTDNVISKNSFNGYLYFRCLTGSDVELGTIYTIYVKVVTYDTNKDPIIKKTILYAEERIGITLFYEDSLNNSNFSFVTSYNEGDNESLHTVQFITRRIGDNPRIEITFRDENGVDISQSGLYDDTPLYYVFSTDDKKVETEGISFRYFIKDIQIPSIFEGTTISMIIKATNTEDNNLIYYSNMLYLRVVPYIVTDIIVDGVNNKNEFIKSYGGNYNLNVNITTNGNCKNSTKMQLKKAVAINNYTWWYYDINETENTRMFTTLKPKTYEFFTISKNGSYYVYTPNFVGFTDKIYMVVTLSYYKGDADNPAGYIVETNAGPVATESGVNPTSQTLNFVLEFTVSSNYRNNEQHALPIYDKEGLQNMEEGVYYILDNDIELDEWTPISTSIASLDGNGYEINIKSFKVDIKETLDCYLGFFSEVATNTVLKNLYITYGNKDVVDEDGHITKSGSNEKFEFSLDSTALTTLYFGGVAAINNGKIYNCSVKNASGKYYIEFIRNDNKEVINYDVKIAGLVGLNKGYVSYSRSELTLVSQVGNMAGLVSENQGTLSSSYYKNGLIINNSTNSTTSKVAGVCVTNTSKGKIYYTYVEGTPSTPNEFQFTGENSGLKFAGNIAGFVYLNQGIVSDCYANIPIRPAGGRNAGFVYTNTMGQISCCYTLCKFTYQNDNGTNASDTPFVGTDAQGNVNFDEENAVLKNVYYYIGDFIKSVTDKEPAEALTKVQFMEDYYFGEYSFSYDDGSYNNYSYEVSYDMFEEDISYTEQLQNKNSYSGLDAVWTYDEFHLYPKLVEANNIAVSRKEISFKPYVEVANYYNTFAIGYANTFAVSTNKLQPNQSIKLSLVNANNVEVASWYSDNTDICTEAKDLSTYYISIYTFNFTPDNEIFRNYSQISVSASVVVKGANISYDDNNNPIVSDEVLRTSAKVTMNVTPEEKFSEVTENEDYSSIIEDSMNVEYSTNSVTGVKVSEKLGNINLYSCEPGTSGNPEIISTAEQYNTVMYQDSKDVENGIEQSGSYRLVADVDFSNTQIDENSINNVFSGMFDGAGFTIEGLTLIDYSKTIDSFGLFNTVKGSTYGTGVVKNLRLVPLKVYANYIFTVGTLTAKVVGGRVYNIIVDADEVTVKGKNIVGGVIGMVLDNIRVNQKYYEFLSDDLVGTKTIYKSIVQNITSTINVNATSRVSSTNYFLISNINSQKTSFYQQNVRVAYSGVGIGAVIQSSGTSRLDKAGVYDIKVIGNSIAVGEIIGTAIGFVGEKSYVDLVSVKINVGQYLNASLIAGGIIGENRGLVSRATIEHENGQDLIDAREKEYEELGSQNTTFFKKAILSIGGVIGFNNGGILENSYSRIDCRNESTIIAGGLIGIAIGGEFYNCYVSGSVYAKTIIGGVIGATSTADLFAPLQTAMNANASLVSSESHSEVSTSKEVIIDSVLGLNKWLKVDYSTFYEKVHNSNGDITDAYPIGALIGSIQLNSKEETNSYDITTYSTSFKKLYVDYDVATNKYFKIYDYGNKISSLTSSGVAFSNTQNSAVYENNYANEISEEKLQNNYAFTDYSTTIWEYTDRASTKILPILRAVSNLNTKKSTLTVKYMNESSQVRTKTMLLIDGINGEETAIKPLGTIYNPYKIVAPSQLRYFAIHDNIITNGDFKESKIYLTLADNISLVAYSNWIPIGDGLNDYKFSVIFNGNNYQISGITSDSATTGTQERFVGLFGFLQTGSIISDLRTKVRFNLELEGGNIYVGGISATAYNTSINNCETEGKINFLNKYAAYFSIGGIVGQTVSEGGSSSIENSTSHIIITSQNIVSRVQKKVNGSVTSYIDGVYKDVKVNAKVGGVAGFNQNSIISNCNNTGSITISPVKSQTPLAFTEPTFEKNIYIEDEYSNYSVFEDILYIGGIVGSNVGQIKTSTNSGSIYSYSYAGGIAGINMDNGQISYAKDVYNINECINMGTLYLTAGYKSGSTTAYAGGIAGYSSGSINKSINLGQIQVKTYCQFSVGGIAGAMAVSDNAYITHCYVSAYNDYNALKNIISIDSITKFKSKSKIELVYGTAGTSSASVPNKVGLICNDGTDKLKSLKDINGVTGRRIYDNLSYGDINVNDPTGSTLSIEKDLGSNYDGDGQPTGLVDKVFVKMKDPNNSSKYFYITEATVSKSVSNQTTYGQLTAGKNKAVYGTNTTKNDITYWEKNFFSVPDYIGGGENIPLSELRWNAKVFTMLINFKDSENSDPDMVASYISVYLVNPDKNIREPITGGEESSFYLATTSGYLMFELQEHYEIYYIMIKRNDTTDYLEFNESDLVSTIITVNGYDYGNDVLVDLSPNKDVKFTITVKIRTVDEGK